MSVGSLQLPHRSEAHSEELHEKSQWRSPVSCTLEGCGFRAKTKSNLKLHQETHNEAANIPCPVPGCTYLARYNAILGVHVKRHRRNPEFQMCPEPRWNYAATTFESFQVHQGVHNTGREFVCPLCPKFFASKSNLELHSFSHTKEKPLKCSYCDYGCYDKKSFMLHSMKHHEGKQILYNLLRPTARCRFCSFDVIQEEVLTHAASQHNCIVMLERFRLKNIWAANCSIYRYIVYSKTSI